MISWASLSGFSFLVIPTFRHISARREFLTSAVSSLVLSELGTVYVILGCLRVWISEADSSAAFLPAILPKTRPSSSELLARRLAPCRPVAATSPAA